MMDMSEFKDLFAAEAQEHLETMNAGLLALERDPADTEALADVFRAAHTLKGIAATMGYDELAALAHAVEDRLDALREGKDKFTTETANLLFQAVDALKSVLSDVLADRPVKIDVEQWQKVLREFEEPTTETPLYRGKKETGAPTRSVIAPLELPQTIRVNTRHLDDLLNIVAELVISRSHLWRLQETYNLPELKEALEKHDRLLSNLRDAVLQTRMVPVAHIFNRFPRMVRDLLRERGKEADFIIEGYDIELDRTILERVSDPLMHLLRNAVDHGIEPPEERKRAGKPLRGKIWLRAWRERESVIIEVADDGKGMQKARILKRAIEQGLITPEEAEELNDHQVFMLICEPGFSTADHVTAVSGRGVGMDVVRREIEALHGTLTIDSQPGQGTTFRLRLPLTLAIVQALLVMVGTEMYAIPLSQVERTLEIRPDQVTEIQQWQIVTDEEKKALPLVSLSDLLEVPDTRLADQESRYAIVVGEERRRVGLVADKLLGQEEIVIRPLPAILGHVPGIAGASILGEGRVILILDPSNLL